MFFVEVAVDLILVCDWDVVFEKRKLRRQCDTSDLIMSTHHKLSQAVKEKVNKKQKIPSVYSTPTNRPHQTNPTHSHKPTKK